jgi:uncharacterized membrane protein
MNIRCIKPGENSKLIDYNREIMILISDRILLARNFIFVNHRNTLKKCIFALITLFFSSDFVQQK